MCDFYGLPIPTTDLSTIDISPDDPLYQSIINKNLNSKGEIKDNSELAKFINFCSNRQSPWGVQDANILNALQTDGGIIVNNMPVVGDIIDVINAVEDQANIDWATGKNCINSADNPRWDNEFKYYQLYVQDMRILDTMKGQDSADPSNNLLTAQDLTSSNFLAKNQTTTYNTDTPDETNPVLAYEQRYLENHPLDQTPEGILARISGNTKEDIIFLRTIAEYSQELASYHPEQRFAFHNETKQPIELLEDFELKNTPSSPLFAIIPTHAILPQDKRNYLV